MASDAGDTEWVHVHVEASDDEDRCSINAGVLDAKVRSALPPFASIRVTKHEPDKALLFTARFSKGTQRSYRLERAQGEEAILMMKDRFKQLLMVSQFQNSSTPILGTLSTNPNTHFLLQELGNNQAPARVVTGKDSGISKIGQDNDNTNATTPIKKKGTSVRFDDLFGGSTNLEDVRVLEYTDRKEPAVNTQDIEDSPTANFEVSQIKKEKEAPKERPVTLKALMSGEAKPEMMRLKQYEEKGGVEHLKLIRTGTVEIKDTTGKIDSFTVYYDTLADRNFVTCGLANSIEHEEVFRTPEAGVETCTTLLKQEVEVPLEFLLNLNLRCKEGDTEEFGNEDAYLVNSDERVLVMGWNFILRRNILRDLADQIAIARLFHNHRGNEDPMTTQTGRPQFNHLRVGRSEQGQQKCKKHDDKSRADHLDVEDRIARFNAAGGTTSQNGAPSNMATYTPIPYPQAAHYPIGSPAASPPLYNTTLSTASSQDSEWTHVTADTALTAPTQPEQGQQDQQMKVDGYAGASNYPQQSGGYSAFPVNNAAQPQGQYPNEYPPGYQQGYADPNTQCKAPQSGYYPARGQSLWRRIAKGSNSADIRG